MVAVCRMAPQAALLEQSLAVGHRHTAGSTTQARRAGHRASQPVQFKRPHRVSGPPVTTLQFTGLVKVANADPRGDFLPFEAKRASRDYTGGFLCQRLGLHGITGLLSVSLDSSPFRAATTEGNRLTHSVDRSPDGSSISWAYWCPKRRSASVRLKRYTTPWSLCMSTRPRRTWTECFASS